MKVYIGTRNMRYEEVRYDVGYTHIFTGDFKNTNFGFIVHKNVADINKSFKLDDPDTIVLEAEIPPDTQYDEIGRDKLRTNKVKVLRVLNKDDIEKVSNGRVKFDKCGKIAFIEYHDGYWEKFEYNDNGHEVYWENSNGEKICKEYDNHNRLISVKTSKGGYGIFEYDDKGNVIYHEEKDLEFDGVIWVKSEYDERGNLTYYEAFDGCWEENQYDEKGRLIFQEGYDGQYTYWTEYVYDEKDRLIFEEGCDGGCIYWIKYVYDDENNRKTIIRSNGMITTEVYDGRGKLIKRISEDKSGHERIYIEEYEYDKYGHLLYYKDSKGRWFRKRYDNHGNLRYYENSDGRREWYERGNLVRAEFPSGFWIERKYNEDNVEICCKRSDGFEYIKIREDDK